MGKGEINSQSNISNPEWEFHRPGTIGLESSQLICFMAEGLEISDQELKFRINHWKEYYQR